MALGALLGAYLEDDSGSLRALVPLAGRSLLEYQVRCASAAGAAPVVVMVERVPQALQDAFERLRERRLRRVPGQRRARGRLALRSRIGDSPDRRWHRAAGSAPARYGRGRRAGHRRRSGRRRASAARADRRSVALGRGCRRRFADARRDRGDPGDWDLQSTLLRRAVQEGAARIAVQGDLEPLLVETPGQLQTFESNLLAASRQPREDWASRYLLSPVEELATAQLMDSSIRPAWLLWTALLLTLGGARDSLAAGSVPASSASACRPRSTSSPPGWRFFACDRCRRLHGCAVCCGRPPGWRLQRSVSGRCDTTPAGGRWSPHSPPLPSPKRRGSSCSRTRGRPNLAILPAQRDFPRHPVCTRAGRGPPISSRCWSIPVRLFLVQHVRRTIAELTRS